jgi:hypothetical protein
MEQTESDRRHVYVRAADLELWRCHPLESVEVLDLKDRPVGRFDGILLDVREDRPLFLVICRERSTKSPNGSKKGSKWFLFPVGDAWFDDTERAIRIDVNVRRGEAASFDPDEFEKMTPDAAAAYELRVLGLCCPEVGVHRDGTPDYSRHAAFTCPPWLRSPSSERLGVS